MKREPGKSSTTDEALEAARVRIDRWRRSRKKKTAMPEKLWEAAVSLTAEWSVSAVARALKVDYTSLKLRVVQAELDGGSSAVNKVGFVELSAAQVIGSPEPSVSVVELSDADGAHMAIRIPADQPVDIVGLSGMFWSRGR